MAKLHYNFSMSKIQFQINTRQRSIIHAILESDSHVTLKEISDRTQLSVRIIRYNMDTILAWFRNEGINVDARPGYGYGFDISDKRREEMLRALNNESDQPISLTRKQRHRLGLLELLIADKPLSFQYLASNSGISRSTVVTDTANMQEWLNRYRLTLIKTPNRGTYIEGSEFMRRNALVDLIRDEVGLVKYYSLWIHPDMSQFQDHALPGVLEKYLRSLPLTDCVEFIRRIESEMALQLALFSRVAVLLYLAITVQGLQKQRYTRSRNEFFTPEKFEIEDCHELEIAAGVMDSIREKIRVKPNEYETNALAVNLLFAKWDNEEEFLQGSNVYTGELSYNISHDAIICADMITAACANQLHPLLQTDEELVMNLARHFHTIFNQIKYGYPVINENLPMILEEYPEIFRSVNSEISVIEDQINFKLPPEEIGYIAMYMVSALNKLQTIKVFKISVIILGDGIRTKSIFLKDRLQLMFPTLEVISLVNGYPEDESILEKADLILSLIPGVFVKTPVIEVSPSLTQNEIRTIQNWIINHEENNRHMLLSPSKKPDLVELLQPENILLNVEAKDWKDVINIAARPLEDKNLIKPEFCDAMIHITEEYGAYTMLAPGVVLLNARPNDGVNRLCMSMLKLKDPVDFGEESNISIAFVLGASDNHTHLNALFQLSQVCGNAEFIANLRKCTRPTEVQRAIWVYAADYSLNQISGQ